MMKTSEVYFSDLRADAGQNLFHKLEGLLKAAGLAEVVRPRGIAAMKLHFGEKGNAAFIRPLFLRKIADCIRETGAFPFLTDTNTLYAGSRGNSVSHMQTAVENGFAWSVVQAPVIIADGLRGASFSAVEVRQETVQTAFLGKEIVESDALVSIAHFKGHELCGFGGALKNVGMGCASRKGKLQIHSGLSPGINRKRCTGCGECGRHCAHKAITLKEKKAYIDPGTCVGCGECILICPRGLISVKWSKDMVLFQKKMVEYTLAVLQDKKERALFINFLTDISPACDCAHFNDTPIVRDIGILASRDPVAIDQASVDLVNSMPGSEQSALRNSMAPGADKFRDIYPDIDWRIQLEYAEKIGLGSRGYRLKPIQGREKD